MDELVDLRASRTANYIVQTAAEDEGEVWHAANRFNPPNAPP